MCCSLLRCDAVLQCVAVCCSVLQCVAVCCIVMQCVTVCCSVLQCVAACYSVLQRTTTITHHRDKATWVYVTGVVGESSLLHVS